MSRVADQPGELLADRDDHPETAVRHLYDTKIMCANIG